jgi:hypothetical protein
MAIDLQIQKQLEGVVRRQGRIEFWSALAMCWAGAALIGLAVLVLERQIGWTSSLVLPSVLLLGLLAAIVIDVRQSRHRPALPEIARRIEARHPELEGRLVTALQQEPGPSGHLNYLQQRLVQETIAYGRRTDWLDTIPLKVLRLAQATHWLALALFAITLFELRGTGGGRLLSRLVTEGITVTPGDISLERGSSLVVLARFKGALPPKVELAFGQPAALQRVSLVKSLGDPMFGGSIPEVSSNFVYRVEFGGQSTRDFNVIVYDHPRLERSDVDLTFPAYTALPRKRIENTRRLSAVEGSQVDLALQFNKPVTSARLLARDKERAAVPLAIEAGQPRASLKQFVLESSKTYDLQLIDSEGRTNKVPAEFVFEALKNRPPEMRLTSPRGDLRPSPIEEIPFEGTVWDDFGVQAFGLAYAVNGQNPQFIELGRSVPGNQKKSFRHLLRLEELGVKPDELVSWFVWADDLGPDGQVRRTMGDLYFGEVRPFEEVFREGQGMEGQGGGEQSGGEDQTGKLADLQKQIVNATWKLERDHSNTGDRRAKSPESIVPPRRAPERSSDQSQNWAVPAKLFAGMPPGINGSFRVTAQVAQADQDQSNASDVSPSRPSRRASVQAPGKGQPPKYEDDAAVVLDSQQQALEQAKDALQRQRDPQSAGLWQKAVTEMELALARLQQATNSPATLKDALAAEQAAYQALIQLQAHEYQVSRSRNRGQSGRNQQMQRQLEELDLTETENRYENQREAQRTQNPERREQLQIMSRLQELARRQQDLNARLKELQAALQEARTEEERAEIRRQLKRLQEEEQQMLADVDELRQRMDRPENQSRLADERRQLDQTRQEVQRAADAASQGAASQALAAGTRAQNQLQQLRDDLRRKNSSQFADDLRQMRSQARELARQQEDILKKIQDGSSGERKSLSAAPEQEEMRSQLARQKELMTNLLERATQVSQQAEEAEPLLSHQLYDTVRKFTQDSAKDLKEAESELINHGPMTRSLFELLRDNSEQGAVKLEEITSEMLRLGYLPQAGRVGERARAGIEELKKGVERAAESVLGDDTEDLRLAQRQLDDLASQLQREIADSQGSASPTNSTSPGTVAAGERRRADGGQANTNLALQAQGQNAAGQSGAGPTQASGRNQDQNDAGAKNAQQGSSSQTAQAQGSGQQSGGAGEEPSETANRPGSAQAGSLASQGGRAQRGSAREAQNETPGAGANGGGDPLEASAAAGAGGGARNFNWDRLLTESVRRQSAPITGEDFTTWSDRLREVEQLIDEADLRDDVAKARERARLFRQEFKRERKKPDWAVVQLQVMKPLTEVRDRIAEELARRESREALVPLDRDPVPNQYSDLVRRYYEELGKEK